jgi:hypothetical protein
MLISFSGVERVSEEPDQTGFFVVHEPRQSGCKKSKLRATPKVIEK